MRRLGPTGTAAVTVPELLWLPEQLLGWVSLPFSLWDLGRERPSRPRWAAPWPCPACSGPSGGVKALLGRLLRFSLGGRPHSFFHSVLFRAFAPGSPASGLGRVGRCRSDLLS